MRSWTERREGRESEPTLAGGSIYRWGDVRQGGGDGGDAWNLRSSNRFAAVVENDAHGAAAAMATNTGIQPQPKTRQGKARPG
jgi:hypothetical protein